MELFAAFPGRKRPMDKYMAAITIAVSMKCRTSYSVEKLAKSP